MKSDITTREDIIFLIDHFYKKILVDKTIGHFFTDVVKIKLDHHMPIMYDFWEGALLDGTSYKGNPMLKHIAIDKIQRLEEKHFAVWVKEWNTTIDTYFLGAIADQAKQKAQMMKDLMMYKISESRKDGFIQ